MKEENEMTLEMMDLYGWWNVRGGSWCQVEMNSCPPALLERQGLNMPAKLIERQRINMPAKLTKGQKKYMPANSTQRKQQICTRCGGNSHLIEQCCTKTTVNGKSLVDSDSNSPSESMDDSDSNDSFGSIDDSETCFRCGRSSHWANDCYAKTDVHGNILR
ncbi:hypothetical protein HDV01_002201 [Terramyces sp. JEL0728]|nr:hypothetical protein HDV01_002201 [Terramyces sp. JEL0728]